MTEFHRVPTMWRYLIWMVVASTLAGGAPYFMCLNFADGFFNTSVMHPSACPLSFTSRLGQAGALIMYVSALLAVMPPLVYAEKATDNRKVAKRLIPKLEARLKSEQAAQRVEAAAATVRELSEARQALREAERYPAVAKVSAWFGLVLIFAGTVMQVVETGA